MKKLVPHLLFILCSLQGMARVASDVQSHNMLSVLGKDKNSPEFKTWKTVMSLDKQYANPAKGVKLVVNEVNGRVESIILAGKNYETGQTRFQSFSSVLPFGISWNDDTAKLIKKLGATEKLLGKNSLKFNRENTGVEIAFASFKSWDIQYVRYFHETPRVPLEKRMTVVKEELKRKSLEDEAHKSPAPTSVVSVPTPEIKMAKMESSYSEFKRGILSVFESYKESAFAKLKGNIRPTGNFWNYKYTYTTGLKIPGREIQYAV
ncbi:MAG: hypothetical protein IPP77_05560 [Bacteroidetes bacterium]|nr:hypothetical protein [Bacteroidota bacterium]